MRFLFRAFCLSLLITYPLFAGWKPSGIYGEDHRREYFELRDEFHKVAADSSVALIGPDFIHREGKSFRLSGNTFGREFGLCRTERFFAQQAPAFCSGVLVGEDLVLTAGHCLESLQECRNTKFVFGFAVKEEGSEPHLLPLDDVYECAGILAREVQGDDDAPDEGADFALVKLSRPVRNHRPIALQATGGPRPGTPLAAYGYPGGLPLKVITDALVRDPGRNLFETNLDTYGGNSGSPVVNTQTGKLEGILIRGDQDFEWSKEGCNVSKRFGDDQGEGEFVMKVDEILARIAGKQSRVQH